MCNLSGKISSGKNDNFLWKCRHVSPMKFSQVRCSFLRTGEQDKFGGDKFLWICWKPRNPRKLTRAKINLAKVYLLKVKKIHKRETATCRSSTRMCFAKSYLQHLQHFWSSKRRLQKSNLRKNIKTDDSVLPTILRSELETPSQCLEYRGVDIY